jgi:hypothetical protein
MHDVLGLLVIEHGIADFVRDILSAVAAGLILVGFSAFFGHVRFSKTRMDRIAVEVRHTQKTAGVEPFYDGEL